MSIIGIFRPAAALVAAVALAACASSRSLDDSVGDLAANANLKGVLFTDRSHDYSDVDITLFEGRLMLTGGMRSEAGRAKLIENAQAADGVEEVIDEIFVGDKTPIGQGLEDARLDQVLRARLIADGTVTSSRYKIAVSRGTVYLLGAARNERELNEALEVARATGGVQKVVSHVILREPGDAQ